MPFACHAAGGVVDLTPAAETSYRVYGTPERQSFTACSPLRPDFCRNWVLHRFDIDCGGARVSWLSVVDAATAEWNPGHAWASGGQLHLRMGRWWGGPAAAPCRMGWRYGNPRWRYGFGAPCANPYSQGIPPVVDLPSGFAPIPARFARLVQRPTSMSAERTQKATEPWAIQQPQVALPEPTSKNNPPPLVDVNPSVGLETLQAPAPGQSTLQGKPPLTAAEIGLALIVISSLGLLSLMSVLAIRQRARAQHTGPRGRARAQPDASSNGRKLLTDAETSEPEDWLPRNRTEALRVLGVGTHATSEFIKTTVRRLRRTWHPDLAQSGEDRRRRNQKLKQINVAWDIICGKRTESYA